MAVPQALRLLERINRADGEGARGRRRPGEEALKASVDRHIRHLLGVRRGNVPTDPEFGVPESLSRHSDRGLPDPDLVGEVIEQLVGRYEPRLQGVSVACEGLDAAGRGLQVTIRGTVGKKPGASPNFVRNCLLLADGRFEFPERRA